MSFHITETALSQIKKNLESANMKALRIGVKKSGCSGFKYFIDFAKEVLEDDIILNNQLLKESTINYDNLLIIANKSSLALLEDATLDYVKQGLNQSFKFSNPKATAECGCGESFSL